MVQLGELVMILDLHRQGLSVSAIARESGLDRKTVRKCIARGLEAPAYGPRRDRPRLLTPYEAYLRERVKAYPGLTGRRLLREIRALGYGGGYSALTDYLREVRPRPAPGFEVRFETPPAGRPRSTSPTSAWPLVTSRRPQGWFGCFPWCSAFPG